MVKRNIDPEDLSKEQLCHLARDVTKDNFDLRWELQNLKEIKAENKRLRDAMEEIEAVACGETQIESDGVYDDSDGMKWVYDKIQALKEK